MIPQNYIDSLFIDSINLMSGSEWKWPDHWDTTRQLQFLNNSLTHAIQHEYWEQAAIIRDVKQSIEKNSGSLPCDSE